MDVAARGAGKPGNAVTDKAAKANTNSIDRAPAFILKSKSWRYFRGDPLRMFQRSTAGCPVRSAFYPVRERIGGNYRKG
jgi:hypothetical protein